MGSRACWRGGDLIPPRRNAAPFPLRLDNRMSKTSRARYAAALQRPSRELTVAIPIPAAAMPASPSAAVVAPQRSALMSWVISDFPNASLLGLAIVGVALALFFYVLLSSGSILATTIDETVARGEWIIAHHAVQTVDPFSWWMGGKPWQNSEWLADLLYALAYRATGGWAGDVLLVEIAMCATGLIMGLTVARKLGGLPLLITIGVAANVVFMYSAARQQTLAFPLIAAWFGGLVVALDQNRAPPLWLALLIAIWANVHGSFVAALALLGPFALEAVMQAPVGARLATARNWIIFSLAAFGAALINPYGFAAYLFPFRLMAIPGLSNIPEWQPLDFFSYYQIESFIIALIGALIVCALRLPLRMFGIRAAIVIALFGMACQHQRFLIVLAICAPVILSGPIARALDQKEVLDWGRTARVATLAVVLVAAVFGAESLVWPTAPRGDGVVLANGLSERLAYDEMTAALNTVPPALRSHRVLNGANYGPYLIFSGVKVFADDRFELYGLLPAEFVYTWLDDNNVDWTFEGVPGGLDPFLDSDPKWVRLYRGNFVSVQVRKSVWDAAKGGAR
jgi:hypothetical protein